MGRSNKVVGRSLATRTALFVVALAVAAVGVLAFAPVASAAEEGCFRDPYGNLVCPTTETRDPKTTVEADLLERPPSTPPNPPETLPFTGADVTLFVVTGAALVGTGAVLVRRTRARRNEV